MKNIIFTILESIGGVIVMILLFCLKRIWTKRRETERDQQQQNENTPILLFTIEPLDTSGSRNPDNNPEFRILMKVRNQHNSIGVDDLMTQITFTFKAGTNQNLFTLRKRFSGISSDTERVEEILDRETVRRRFEQFKETHESYRI